MKKIAILGVTGYIGKSLLSEFFKEKGKYELFLFSRSKDKVKELIKNKPKDYKITIGSFDKFNSLDVDVIINSIGINNPLVLGKEPAAIFKVTEDIDNMILDYLKRKPKTLYINLSSGAVYGDNFSNGINDKSKSILNINNLSVSEYYSIAKINAEAKHRVMSNFNIVDIRVFAFFSQFVDVKSAFLMSEIINCLKNKKVLITSETDIVRDYISPEDLFSLIKLVIKKGKINDFFDVYSLKEVSKFKLLAFLKKKYKLEFSVKEIIKTDKRITKNVYFSKNKKAEILGYKPKYTSLQGIEIEIDKMGF